MKYSILQWKISEEKTVDINVFGSYTENDF